MDNTSFGTSIRLGMSFKIVFVSVDGKRSDLICLDPLQRKTDLMFFHSFYFNLSSKKLLRVLEKVNP